MPITVGLPRRKVRGNTEHILDIAVDDVTAAYKRLRFNARCLPVRAVEHYTFCGVFEMSAIETLRDRGAAHAVVVVPETSIS